MRKFGINFYFVKCGFFVIKFSIGIIGKELVLIYKDFKIFKNLFLIFIIF